MTAVPLDFVYDPFSPEAMSDPLPIYEVLREHFPVYYVEEIDTFYLSRFQDAWDLLSFPENVFVTNEGTVFTRARVLDHNTGPTVDGPTTPLGSHLNYGAPVYDQVRQAHGRGLRAGSVRKLEPFVREMVTRRLDELLPTGQFDLVHDFGGIVSASTICHLFHIPLDEAGDLLDTINGLTRTDNSEGGFKTVVYAQTKLIDFVRPRVAARRAEGPDGSWPLVDGMLEFRIDDRELTDVEIAVNLICVLVGGTETLPKVVGHGLLELSRRPDQLAEVRADLLANSATALEEMNRFCGPAQWFGRTAREEVTIAGQRVRPGQRVAYLTQSTSRDPREFDDPDEFQWNRPIPRTLAFGRGQHFCIGVHVAKLEQRVILEEFLARVSSFEFDMSGAVRLPSSFQWGYSRLPVSVTA